MTANNTQEGNKWHTMQKRVSLTAEQLKAIEKVAAQLRGQTPALFVLVTDRNGQVVDSAGELEQSTEMAELAALLAGDLAASSEIARLIGTYQRHQLILREGESLNSFISEAGHDLVLFVLTTAEVPLGWARLLLQEAAGKLAALKLGTEETTSAAEILLNGDGFEENVQQSIDGLWDPEPTT